MAVTTVMFQHPAATRPNITESVGNTEEMLDGLSVYVAFALQCCYYAWIIILCGNTATEFLDDDKENII